MQGNWAYRDVYEKTKVECGLFRPAEEGVEQMV